MTTYTSPNFSLIWSDTGKSSANSAGKNSSACFLTAPPAWCVLRGERRVGARRCGWVGGAGPPGVAGRRQEHTRARPRGRAAAGGPCACAARGIMSDAAGLGRATARARRQACCMCRAPMPVRLGIQVQPRAMPHPGSCSAPPSPPFPHSPLSTAADCQGHLRRAPGIHDGKMTAPARPTHACTGRRAADPPGADPSSITCSLEMICPSLSVFCANEMTRLGASRPVNCSHAYAPGTREHMGDSSTHTEACACVC